LGIEIESEKRENICQNYRQGASTRADYWALELRAGGVSEENNSMARSMSIKSITMYNVSIKIELVMNEKRPGGNLSA
jgi:hypothetical protein